MTKLDLYSQELFHLIIDCYISKIDQLLDYCILMSCFTYPLIVTLIRLIHCYIKLIDPLLH